jgi:hypothetical protein
LAARLASKTTHFAQGPNLQSVCRPDAKAGPKLGSNLEFHAIATALVKSDGDTKA